MYLYHPYRIETALHMTTHRSITYQMKQSTFSIIYGDITTLDVDVIVSSDDNFLTMGGGVSDAILKAAGPALYADTRNIPRLHLGDVYVSTAGNLPAKRIFHVITIDKITFEYTSVELIKKSVITTLQLCETHKYQTIAFPALATGVAGIPFEDAAYAMTSAIAEYLSHSHSSLHSTIALFARQGIQQSQLDLFYDKAIAKAVELYSAKSLEIQLAGIIKNTQYSELTPVQKNIQGVIEANQLSSVNQFSAHTPSNVLESTTVIRYMVDNELQQQRDSTELIKTEILALQLLLNQLYYDAQSQRFARNYMIAQQIRDAETRLAQLQQFLI